MSKSARPSFVSLAFRQSVTQSLSQSGCQLVSQLVNQAVSQSRGSQGGAHSLSHSARPSIRQCRGVQHTAEPRSGQLLAVQLVLSFYWYAYTYSLTCGAVRLMPFYYTYLLHYRLAYFRRITS